MPNYNFKHHRLVLGISPQQEEGNKNMKNKFRVDRALNLQFESYEAAEAVAKQYTAKNDEAYAVMQAVAVTKTVVPDIEVTKL